jgi:hypothetical protein
MASYAAAWLEPAGFAGVRLLACTMGWLGWLAGLFSLAVEPAL